jgi:putative addiction module component (TIGR02574 family)
MALLAHDDLERLSTSERLELIGQLWDSLDDRQIHLSVAQEEELSRRLETLDEDRKEAVSWAELKDELERRCP